MGDDLTDWTGTSWYPLHINWCHEHCSVCMATACGCVDHGSEWQDGYWSIESDEGYDGTWDLYLCPECFAKLSMLETVRVLPPPQLYRLPPRSRRAPSLQQLVGYAN